MRSVSYRVYFLKITQSWIGLGPKTGGLHLGLLVKRLCRLLCRMRHSDYVTMKRRPASTINHTNNNAGVECLTNSSVHKTESSQITLEQPRKNNYELSLTDLYNQR